jgi:hypothetical protein
MNDRSLVLIKDVESPLSNEVRSLCIWEYILAKDLMRVSGSAVESLLVMYGAIQSV